MFLPNGFGSSDTKIRVVLCCVRQIGICHHYILQICAESNYVLDLNRSSHSKVVHREHGSMRIV